MQSTITFEHLQYYGFPKVSTASQVSYRHVGTLQMLQRCAGDALYENGNKHSLFDKQGFGGYADRIYTRMDEKLNLTNYPPHHSKHAPIDSATALYAVSRIM
jgi:hypothetical protein